MAEPIVAVALIPFEIGGYQIHPRDSLIAQPGRYLKAVHPLPLDLGPIMGADLAGKIALMSPHQPAEFLAAVGLEPVRRLPRPPRRLYVIR